MKKKSLNKHLRKKRKKQQELWYIKYENGKEESNLAIIHQMKDYSKENGGVDNGKERTAGRTMGAPKEREH
jgi:hypothetical protein